MARHPAPRPDTEIDTEMAPASTQRPSYHALEGTTHLFGCQAAYPYALRGRDLEGGLGDARAGGCGDCDGECGVEAGVGSSSSGIAGSADDDVPAVRLVEHDRGCADKCDVCAACGRGSTEGTMTLDAPAALANDSPDISTGRRDRRRHHSNWQGGREKREPDHVCGGFWLWLAAVIILTGGLPYVFASVTPNHAAAGRNGTASAGNGTVAGKNGTVESCTVRDFGDGARCGSGD